MSALLENGLKIVFVSHQYEFTRGFFNQPGRPALFLRADRQTDGRRTFRLVEGEPLGTSFGEDIYRRIFSAEAPGESGQAANGLSQKGA